MSRGSPESVSARASPHIPAEHPLPIAPAIRPSRFPESPVRTCTMSSYTKKNLRTQVEDQAPKFAMPSEMEVRFGRRPLDAETLGLNRESALAKLRVVRDACRSDVIHPACGAACGSSPPVRCRISLPAVLLD